MKKTEANLNMLAVWRKWSFSDEMIAEAAKRAADTTHPLPYMNKILSDWKRENIFSATNIPQKKEFVSSAKSASTFVTPSTQAMDERTDRERFYAAKRAKAEAVAERFEKRALQNDEYKELASALSKTEREAAKAEAFGLENLPTLLQNLELLRAKRASVLTGMGIMESDLTPQYSCKKCSDSGFLPSGRACDCYKK